MEDGWVLALIEEVDSEFVVGEFLDFRFRCLSKWKNTIWLHLLEHHAQSRTLSHDVQLGRPESIR